MKIKQAAALASIIVIGLVAEIAQAKGEAKDPASPSQCETLANLDFSGIQDAPTQITEAKLTNTDGNIPGYCQVAGYVAPQVGFLLRLPPRDWNGKFVELGCGGFCGSTDYITECDDPFRRRYACIVFDNGHTGDGGLWAYNNLQAVIDAAYRATHVISLAAKAIVVQFYGEMPRKSYFWGCSGGGRQALMEAQRFPWDFDGIIAGDPSFVPEIDMAFLWLSRELKDVSTGRLLLNNDDIETLHQAVVAKCDLNDGIKDGLIGDPRDCSFDPSQLLCHGDKEKGCLTARQIEVAKKIYSGPVTSQGKPIYTPMALVGSERYWKGFTGDDRSETDEFRYKGFVPNPGPSWKAADFNFDRDYKRLGIIKALYSPTNPDLREFKAAGGKLLGYTGWSTHVPLHFVDYYETTERTMGGRSKTQNFFRFFAIPGMEHCSGGDGAFAVDWLTYLENWVEKDQAPDRILSSHVRVDNPIDAFLLKFPLNPARVEFSRPVYPYPTRVKYLGHGDPKDAASFGPVEH